MQSKENIEVAKELFLTWYNELKIYSVSGGGPAQGTIGSALIVLERLKTNFNLDIESHLTKGGGQIRGSSGGATKSILALFGENRQYIKEGGRTNRGLIGDIRNMLNALNKLKLMTLPLEERNIIIGELQKILVAKVREFFSRKRLELIFDPTLTTWQTIHNLLKQARETNKQGPVAQYIVGAKLQLRFPNMQIRNESFSAADDQSGQPGDFLVGSTSFHVTISPMSGVYEKCKKNIESGYRAFLIVPSERLVAVMDIADQVMPGKITVQSIESFVSQNIEELSEFSGNRITRGFYRLLKTYNERVEAVEIDKSMLIEIPKNLVKYTEQ